MKAASLESISVQSPTTQLARLSGPHGYRFDGDTVHLNAMFALLHPAAHECSWALQLWACPAAPASVRELAGHIVAEVSLPPMGELADEIEHFDVSAFSRPPAGAGEHVMVLVLASGRAGEFDNIHDLAFYARRQEFVQPRMGGNVGYCAEGERVQLSVERVENPRAAANRSGTLALELWALPETFAGGCFEGLRLAGVEIGSVNGQCELALPTMEVAFTPPPAGDWQIVLMLREWTSDGYVTRDFTNFPVRMVSAPVAEPAPEPIAEEPVVPMVDETPVRKASPRRAARVKVPAAKRVSKRVSVNSADVEELAAVKGLSTKLAERIVKKRPFHALAELSDVKGLGEKVLGKVRSRLKL